MGQLLSLQLFKHLQLSSNFLRGCRPAAMALGFRYFSLACSLGLIPQATGAAEPQKAVAPGEDKGFYATLGIGLNESKATSASKTNNATYNNELYTLRTTMLLQPSSGPTAEAGLGYDFGSIRTELSYLYNNFSLNDSIRHVEASKINANRSISLTVNPLTSQPIQRKKFNANIDANSLMTSVYLDIPTGSRFVPYIGGGVGITRMAINDFPKKHENLQLFGYQAKLGVSYLASCSTDLFAEGAYKASTGNYGNAIDSGTFNSWAARLGARLRFANRCAGPTITPTAAPGPSSSTE
jgi:opacity protein-like surface antigen